MIRKTLQETLKKFDQDLTLLDERIVSDRIELAIKDKDSISDEHEIAEHIAFHFISGFRKSDAGNNDYYRPKFISGTGTDTSEFPSIAQVSEPVLEYWKQRAGQAKHPVLALRYADLVVDFEKRKNNRLNFEMVKRVIDHTIATCTNQLMEEHSLIVKFDRAFSLMQRIRYTYRLNDLCDAAIHFEQRLTDNDKPGLWGHAFRWLLIEGDERMPPH